MLAATPLKAAETVMRCDERVDLQTNREQPPPLLVDEGGEEDGAGTEGGREGAAADTRRGHVRPERRNLRRTGGGSSGSGGFGRAGEVASFFQWCGRISTAAVHPSTLRPIDSDLRLVFDAWFSLALPVTTQHYGVFRGSEQSDRNRVSVQYELVADPPYEYLANPFGSVVVYVCGVSGLVL